MKLKKPKPLVMIKYNKSGITLCTTRGKVICPVSQFEMKMPELSEIPYTDGPMRAPVDLGTIRIELFLTREQVIIE